MLAEAPVSADKSRNLGIKMPRSARSTRGNYSIMSARARLDFVEILSERGHMMLHLALWRHEIFTK